MSNGPLRLASLVTAGLVAALSAEAQDDVVLTVTDPQKPAATVVFDMDDLMRMPQVSYRTSTIWTNGVLEFRGVPLSDVVTESGITEGTLLLRASNDYAVELPLHTVTPDVPIIALTIDGKPMSLRDKGPLWVVYPYDSSTIYQTEVVYTRSVWQLVRIEVLR